MGGEYLNESRDLLMFALVNYWYLRHYLMHVLTHFATWLQLLLLGGDTAENRERVVEGRKYFQLVLLSLECQRKTLSVYYI